MLWDFNFLHIMVIQIITTCEVVRELVTYGLCSVIDVLEVMIVVGVYIYTLYRPLCDDCLF